MQSDNSNNQDNNPPKEKAPKFDINKQDLEPAGNESLHISSEDLTEQDNSRASAHSRRVQLIYCSHCGNGAQVGSRYCPGCGKPLVENEDVAPQVRTSGVISKKKIFVRVAVTLLALGLLVTGGLFLYSLFWGEEEEVAAPSIPAINVPEDYEKIQDAIGAAEDGDEIIVSTGIYYENIDFRGKNLVLRSEDPDDPDVVEETIIDGGRSGPVVIFRHGESDATKLKGFTITKGSGARELVSLESGDHQRLNGDFGGGILVINNSSPLIESNMLVDNISDFGGGISIVDATPEVVNNTIINNRATEYGGGVFVVNSTGLKLTGNKIKNNESNTGGAVWTCNYSILQLTPEDKQDIIDNEPDDLDAFIDNGGL